jgi:hypothetical protein
MRTHKVCRNCENFIGTTIGYCRAHGYSYRDQLQYCNQFVWDEIKKKRFASHKRMEAGE